MILSSSIRRRIVSGAFWGGMAAGGSRLFTIVASFYLARVLGQVGFGEYGMVTSTTGMIGSMAGMGIGLTVTKYISELKTVDPHRAGRIIGLSSIVTLISAVLFGVALFSLSKWLADKTLAAPHLAIYLQISAITVAMGVINSVQSSSLSGFEAFKTASYISIITAFAQTAMVLWGAWVWGMKGAVTSLAVGMILTVLITRIVVTREWKRYNISINWIDGIKEWRVLLRFSLPAFLTSIVAVPVSWAANALLANQPNGYSELGIFNAANQWFSFVVYIPSILVTALLPVLSQKVGSGNSKEAFLITIRFTAVIALVSIPISFLLCILSPIIMEGYGAQFVGGYRTLSFLVVAGTVQAILIPLYYFIVACDQNWWVFVLNILWGLVLLVSSWLLIELGAEGLSVARFIAYIVHFVSYGVFAYIIYKAPDKQTVGVKLC